MLSWRSWEKFILFFISECIYSSTVLLHLFIPFIPFCMHKIHFLYVKIRCKIFPLIVGCNVNALYWNAYQLLIFLLLWFFVVTYLFTGRVNAFLFLSCYYIRFIHQTNLYFAIPFVILIQTSVQAHILHGLPLMRIMLYYIETTLCLDRINGNTPIAKWIHDSKQGEIATVK